MLCVGTDVSIVCAEGVTDAKERQRLLASLKKHQHVSCLYFPVKPVAPELRWGLHDQALSLHRMQNRSRKAWDCDLAIVLSASGHVDCDLNQQQITGV